MADKGRPWMRWHITRWRNSPSVLKMGIAAQGAYRNLLEAAWQMGGRLPNDPDVLWKYALTDSPQEFAALVEKVMPMFQVSADGGWLTNSTLDEEFSDRVTHERELSRKRSAAGKKGNVTRWKSGTPSQEESQTESQVESQNDGKVIANADLRSPNLLETLLDIAIPSQDIAKKIREEKKREEKKPAPDEIISEKTIEVAQWKCVDLGLSSPRWSRPNDALLAFDGALQSLQREQPDRPLTAQADELGALWLEYTRSAKGSGQYAMGPAKFFGEGWYRRAAAWRDQPQEPAAQDGTAFIEEKRRKREAASSQAGEETPEDRSLREAALRAELEAATGSNL
jgi:uncharacterized protein YdaU (DUF1376 family)